MRRNPSKGAGIFRLDLKTILTRRSYRLWPPRGDLIRESELPENMAEAPLISDLLSDVERIQKTNPAERARCDGIEFYN